MPFTGQVDVSDIIKSLGDDTHGLRAGGAAENQEEQDEDYVYRATWGETDMSTAMHMVKAWKMIWDNNGYYRALGIHWPFTPTKGELRLGYLDNDGIENEYLTYVLTQLLNPEVREKYDNLPLGRVLRDKYVIAEELRALSEMAAAQSLEDGDVVTIGDILEGEEEWQAEQNRFQIEPLNPLNYTWEWGFYLLKSRKNDYADLMAWQEMLIAAFHARGIARTICIGYIGKTKKRFVVREWYDKTIIFLNEDVEPTMELAEAVASLSAPKRKELE